MCRISQMWIRTPMVRDCCAPKALFPWATTSIGHWVYDNVSAARDAGVNLAFLSENSIWGVVPLPPSTGGQPKRSVN